MPVSLPSAFEFVNASIRVRSETEAEALVLGWKDAFCSEPFWSEQGTYTSRMLTIRVALMPLYAEARAALYPSSKPKAAAAAQEPSKATLPRKRVNKYAVVVGAPGALEPEASKRFPDLYHAEQWAFDRLTDSSDPRSVAIVHNLVTEINERVISRDEGLRRSGRVVHGDPAVYQRSGNAKGPWMKAQQTRSSFSRG